MKQPLTFLRRRDRVYVLTDELVAWLVSAESNALHAEDHITAQAFRRVRLLIQDGVKAEP